MTDMTPAARQRLDDYLMRLRIALSGAPAPEAEEVEQNVREHIEIALANAQTPVSETAIIGILDRLGSPEQWLGDEEPEVRRPEVARPAQTGSLLPYVSFGLVIASIVLIPVFGFLLLIPAMFVSRSWIDQTRERGEEPGSRRWLVYPAIALTLAFAIVLVFLFPPLLALTVTRDAEVMGAFDVPASAAGELRFLAGLRCMAFGVWWIVAGGICAAAMRPIRYVFAPLLDGLRRKHLVVLACTGGLIAVVGAGLMYYRH